MIHIIIKETKVFLRDKTNLIFMMLFPMILVFLLGNLLSRMDEADKSIGEIKIQYLNETEDIYQTMMIENFVSSIADNQNIIFEKTSDINAAKQLAGKDEIAAAIKFSGNPLKIEIYEGSNHIKNRTVGAIMNGFVQTNKAITTLIKTVPEALTGGVNPQGEFIKQKDLGVNRSMLDYYAVTMLTMVSFLSIIVGSMVFLSERQDKTLNRLMIAPMSKLKMFFAKILGLLPQCILQITILMASSVFIFKAHYAANLLDNLYLFLMFFVVTVMMISVGALFGLFIKGSPMVILMPALWTMMFLSGTYSKILYIEGITNRMPIYLIQQAAFDLSVFGRYKKASIVILIGILVTIIMLSIGAFIFSRKEEER